MRSKLTAWALQGCIPSQAPLEVLPLATRLEPTALEGWTLELPQCGPKGSRAFVRILSTEKRGVCLWWAHSKPEGPNGRGVRLWWARIDPECPKTGVYVMTAHIILHSKLP